MFFLSKYVNFHKKLIIFIGFSFIFGLKVPVPCDLYLLTRKFKFFFVKKPIFPVATFNFVQISEQEISVPVHTNICTAAETETVLETAEEEC